MHAIPDDVVDLTADDDESGAAPVPALETIVVRPTISQAWDAAAQAISSRQDAPCTVNDRPTAPPSITPAGPPIQPPPLQPAPQESITVSVQTGSDATPAFQPFLVPEVLFPPPHAPHAVAPSAVGNEMRMQRPKRQSRPRVSFEEEDDRPQHLTRASSGSGSRRPTMEAMQAHLDQLCVPHVIMFFISVFYICF